MTMDASSQLRQQSGELAWTSSQSSLFALFMATARVMPACRRPRDSTTRSRLSPLAISSGGIPHQHSGRDCDDCICP